MTSRAVTFREPISGSRAACGPGADPTRPGNVCVVANDDPANGHSPLPGQPDDLLRRLLAARPRSRPVRAERVDRHRRRHRTRRLAIPVVTDEPYFAAVADADVTDPTAPGDASPTEPAAGHPRPHRRRPRGPRPPEGFAGRCGPPAGQGGTEAVVDAVSEGEVSTPGALRSCDSGARSRRHPTGNGDAEQCHRFTPRRGGPCEGHRQTPSGREDLRHRLRRLRCPHPTHAPTAPVHSPRSISFSGTPSKHSELDGSPDHQLRALSSWTAVALLESPH